MSEKIAEPARLVLPVLRAMQADIDELREMVCVHLEHMLRTQEQIVQCLEDAVLVVPDEPLKVAERIQNVRPLLKLVKPEKTSADNSHCHPDRPIEH